MFKYFLSVVLSTLSYSLLVVFVDKHLIPVEKKDIIDVFLHINIINIILFFIFYNFLKVRGKIDFTIRETLFGSKKDSLYFLLYFFPIVSALYKANILSFVPLTTLTISSMIIPVFTCFLAVIFLKERINPKCIKYIVVALIGFVITNYNKFGGGFGYIHLVLFYIILDSAGEISKRFYCRYKKYGIQGVMAEMIIFFVYGCSILILRNSFSLKLLFNPYLLLVGLVCFAHHCFMVYGVRQAKTIISVEFLTFLKPVLTCFWMFLLASEIPSIYKVVGGIVVGIAVIGFKKHRV